MKYLHVVPLTIIIFCVLLGGCSTTKKTPENIVELRGKLTRLQSDPQLSSRAPVAIKEAEKAVNAAETLPKDKILANHLWWVADHKIDLASEQAQARYLEDQRKSLGEARETARLDSRTQEADRALSAADEARRQAEDLQRQLAELNAKKTDRGIVITLGDVLFEIDRSELKSGTLNNLGKLSAFLAQYPDKTISIEGHTDSVGDDSYNLALSERRASSVKSFLSNQGVSSNRMQVIGKGEGLPVATNDSSSGRQLNRRVEIIISNVFVTAH